MTPRLPDDGAREAFWARAAPAEGTGCPAAGRLWDAVHGGLAARDLEAIVEHTAVCAACAEAWRLALELRREEEMAGRQTSPPLRWRRWVPLAAAAGLLVALGLNFRADPPASLPSYREPSEVTVRSLVAEDRPLARERFLLRWSGGPPGSRYDVLVTGEDFAEVLRARGLTEPRLLVPAAALEKVPSGARLLWQVQVLLPAGERRLSSTFYAQVE